MGVTQTYEMGETLPQTSEVSWKFCGGFFFATSNIQTGPGVYPVRRGTLQSR